jgi:catechol 2,3-dioxygenase-like lactoylglutathione lyase family enzyme
MEVRRLDHVNIQTARLDEMCEWYASVLGLRTGPRPNFPFPGAWLYAGEHAVIHLVGVSHDDAVGSEARLKLEHFALSANGREQFEEKLRALNVPYRSRPIPDIEQIQVHLHDPDGNHLHIDFDANELG